MRVCVAAGGQEAAGGAGEVAAAGVGDDDGVGVLAVARAHLLARSRRRGSRRPRMPKGV